MVRVNQDLGLHKDVLFYLAVSYSSPSRFMSIYEQLALLTSREFESMLEIGVGSGVLQFLARRLGKRVSTFDHNEKLESDFRGSLVDRLPFEDDQFDVVAAFEVLEHLPLKHLPSILTELSRVCRDRILISVPNRNWFFRISLSTNYFTLNRVISIRRMLKIWEPVNDLNPQKDMHYWHLGDRGVSQGSVCKTIVESGLVVERVLRSAHNPNHHFFVLRC